MNLLSLLDSGVCARLVLTLAHFLWQGAAIAALALAAAWLLRRSSVGARYAVLVAALGLTPLCPVVTFLLVDVPADRAAPPGPGPQAGAARAAPPFETTAVPRSDPSDRSDASPSPFQGDPQGTGRGRVEPAAIQSPTLRRETPNAASPPPAPWWRRFAPHLTLAYLIGVLVMALRLLVGLGSGRRLRRASEPIAESDLVALIARQARQIRLKVAPAVAWCGQVTAPTVVGVFRATILLPLGLATGLTTEQMAALLTHELAHVRRYDHLVNILQRLIEAALFFHPAVWLLSRRIRIEREHCCDDAVVAAGGEPFAYADSLVQVAERSLSARTHRRVSVASLGAADRPSRLRSRVLRLVGAPCDRHVRLSRAWPLGLALVAALAVLGIVVSCAGQGTARAPDATLASPDGSYEVRVFTAGGGFDLHIERAVVFKDGRAAETLTEDHPALKGKWIEAVGDDGALYLGARSGHLRNLHDVYVYRNGRPEYLGPPPSFGISSRARGAAGGAGAWWSQWEREMRAVLEAGPALDGLRLRVRPERGVFREGEPVRLELSLLNVGPKVVPVPPDALDQVWFRLLDAPGDRDRIKRRSERGAWEPDQQRTHSLKPGETMRTVVDLMHYYDLPPGGGYRLSADLNHNWRRGEGRPPILADSLPSNEFLFIIEEWPPRTGLTREAQEALTLTAEQKAKVQAWFDADPRMHEKGIHPGQLADFLRTVLDADQRRRLQAVLTSPHGFVQTRRPGGGEQVDGLKVTLRVDQDTIVMPPGPEGLPPVPLALAFECVRERPIKLNAVSLPDAHLRFRVRALEPDGADATAFSGVPGDRLPEAAAADFPLIAFGKTWEVGAKDYPSAFGRALAGLRKPGRYGVRVVYTNTDWLNKKCGKAADGCWTGVVASNEVVLTVREPADADRPATRAEVEPAPPARFSVVPVGQPVEEDALWWYAAYTPDGTKVTENGAVYDSQTGELLNRITRADGSYAFMKIFALSPDGSNIAFCDNGFRGPGNTIHWYGISLAAVDTGKIVKTIEIPEIAFMKLYFPSNSRVVAVSYDRIYDVDVQAGKVVHEWRVGGRGVAVSPDGRQFTQLRIIFPTDEFAKIKPHPDQLRYVVTIHDLETGKEVAELPEVAGRDGPGGPISVGWTPDGRYVVVGASPSMGIFEVQTKTQVPLKLEGWQPTIPPRMIGNRLILLVDDKSERNIFLDLPTRSLIPITVPAEGKTLIVAVAPDGVNAIISRYQHPKHAVYRARLTAEGGTGSERMQPAPPATGAERIRLMLDQALAEANRLAKAVVPASRPDAPGWWTLKHRDPYTGRLVFRRLSTKDEDTIELEISFDERGGSPQLRSDDEAIADLITRARQRGLLESAPPPTRPEGPAWGEAVDGLRLGLRAERTNVFLRPDGTNIVPVNMHFIIQNASDKPVKIHAYDFPWQGIAVEVIGPDGKAVPGSVALVDRIVPPPRGSDFPVIQPGDSFTYDKPLSYREREYGFPFVGATEYRLSQAGAYRIKGLYTITRDDMAQTPLAAGCWTGTLKSGEITLTVVRPATCLDLDAAAEVLRKEVGGTWGKYVTGAYLAGTIVDPATKLPAYFRVFPYAFDKVDEQTTSQFLSTANGKPLGANDRCTVTAYQPIGEELSKAMAKALDLSPPRITIEALVRARALRAVDDSFAMAIWIRMPESADAHCVLLWVYPAETQPANPYDSTGQAKFTVRPARVTKEQARRIVDHLVADGFADRGVWVRPQEMPEVKGPAAVWMAGYLFGSDAKVVAEDLGWGPTMLARLDGLRKILDGDAAKAMDELLRRLEPHRKEWERAASPATRPADLETQRQRAWREYEPFGMRLAWARTDQEREQIAAEVQQRLAEWYAGLDVEPPTGANWLTVVGYDLMPQEQFERVHRDAAKVLADLGTPLPADADRRQVMTALAAVISAVSQASGASGEPATDPETSMRVQAVRRWAPMRGIGPDAVPAQEARRLLDKVLLIRARFRSSDLSEDAVLPPNTWHVITPKEQYRETFIALYRPQTDPLPDEWLDQLRGILQMGFTLTDSVLLTAEGLAGERARLLRPANPAGIREQAPAFWRAFQEQHVEQVNRLLDAAGGALERMGTEGADQRITVKDLDGPMSVYADANAGLILVGPVTLPGIPPRARVFAVRLACHQGQWRPTGGAGHDFFDRLRLLEEFLHEHPTATLVTGTLPPWYNFGAAARPADDVRWSRAVNGLMIGIEKPTEPLVFLPGKGWDPAPHFNVHLRNVSSEDLLWSEMRNAWDVTVLGPEGDELRSPGHSLPPDDLNSHRLPAGKTAVVRIPISWHYRWDKVAVPESDCRIRITYAPDILRQIEVGPGGEGRMFRPFNVPEFWSGTATTPEVTVTVRHGREGGGPSRREQIPQATTQPAAGVQSMLGRLNLTPDQEAAVEAWMAKQGAAIEPARLVEFLHTIVNADQRAALERLVAAPKGPELVVHTPGLLEWGQPANGLQCALIAPDERIMGDYKVLGEKGEVQLGSKVAFDLHLGFDAKGAETKTNLLNRSQGAWKVKLTFTDVTTGKAFERLPFDVGMPRGMDTGDIVLLRGADLPPERVDVHLLSEKGEQIPPGVYRVVAAYENTAKPEVEVKVEPDGLVTTRPYRGAWTFWKGTITSAPIILKVTPAEPAEVDLEVNSGLVVETVDGRLFWRWSEVHPWRVRVARRPGYQIGKRYTLRFVVSGERAEETRGGLGTGTFRGGDAPGSRSALPEEVSRRALAGEPLMLRADIEVFETSVPVQHAWNPEAGDFKVLWTGTAESAYVPPAARPAGETSAEVILRKLQAADETERRDAIRMAAQCRDDRVQKALLDLLDDEKSRDLWEQAMLALGAIGDETCVEPLVKMLAKGGYVSSPAREALVAIGSRSAVDLLIPLLGPRGNTVTEEAGNTLRRLTGEIFGDSPDLWKTWWAEHREEYLAHPNLPYPKLSAEDERRARECVALLGEEKTRDRAIEELVRLGPGAIPFLKPKLLDNGNRLLPAWYGLALEAALTAIGRMGPEGVQELGRLARIYAGEFWLSRPAWNAMVKADRNAAAEFALRCMAVDPASAGYSLWLDEAAGPAQGAAIRKLIRDTQAKAYDRSRLVPVLVKVEGRNALPFLGEAVADKKLPHSIRQAAFAAIGQMDADRMAQLAEGYFTSIEAVNLWFDGCEFGKKWPKQVVPVLERLRDGTQPEQRRAMAAGVLHFLQQPGAAAALAAFVKSTDAEARRGAVRHFADYGGGEAALADLQRLAQHEANVGTRCAAISALVATRKEDVLPTLVKLMHDPERLVAVAATRALEQMTGLGYVPRPAPDDQAVLAAVPKFDAWWAARATPGGDEETWRQAFWSALDEAAKTAQAPVAADLQPQLLVPFNEKIFRFYVVDVSRDGVRAAIQCQIRQREADVVLLDRNARQARRLSGFNVVTSLAISPNGDTVAVIGQRTPIAEELLLIPWAGGQEKVLRSLRQPERLPGAKPTRMVACNWAGPDRLAVRLLKDGVETVLLVDAADGRQREVFDAGEAEKQWPFVASPDLKPDQRLVLPGRFSAVRDDLWFAAGGRVFRTDGRSGKTDLVADAIMLGGHSSPSISPTGSRLLLRASDGEDAYVLAFDPDFGNGRLLATCHAGAVPPERQAAWFHDGRHAVVTDGGSVRLATADGLRQVAVPLRKGAICWGVEPLGADAVAVFAQNGIWRVRVGESLRRLDATPVPASKFEYPDLSTPEGTLATFWEAGRRGDLKTLWQCMTLEFKAELEADIKPLSPDTERGLRIIKQEIALSEGLFAPLQEKAEIKGDRAVIPFRGQPPWHLVKKGDEWRLAGKQDAGVSSHPPAGTPSASGGAAAAAQTRAAVPPEVQKWIDALAARKPGEGVEACRRLAMIGEKAAAAVPAVAALLADGHLHRDWIDPQGVFLDVPVGAEAARALTRMGPAGIEALRAALYGGNTTAREHAAFALWRVRPAGVEILIKALKDPDAERRLVAARALGNAREPEVVQPLLDAFTDEDARVREAAVAALSGLWQGKPLEPLLAALKDREPAVRTAAARVLGAAGRSARAAVDPLVAALRDRNDTAACAAARALGEVQDPSAVDALVAMLKRREMPRVSAAAQALVRIRDARGIDAVAQMLESRDRPRRGVAAEAFESYCPAPAVPGLAALLKDEEPWVRKAAATALSISEDPRAVEPLISALTDVSLHVRWRAAQGLWRLKDRRAVEPLTACLTDDWWGVRESAAEALGAIGDRRAVPALIAALRREYRDPPGTWEIKYGQAQRSMRRRAAEALKAITGQEFGTDAAKWEAWWNAQATSRPTPSNAGDAAKPFTVPLKDGRAAVITPQADKFGGFVSLEGFRDRATAAVRLELEFDPDARAEDVVFNVTRAWESDGDEGDGRRSRHVEYQHRVGDFASVQYLKDGQPVSPPPRPAEYSPWGGALDGLRTRLVFERDGAAPRVRLELRNETKEAVRYVPPVLARPDALSVIHADGTRCQPRLIPGETFVIQPEEIVAGATKTVSEVSLWRYLESKPAKYRVQFPETRADRTFRRAVTRQVLPASNVIEVEVVEAEGTFRLRVLTPRPSPSAP